MLLLTACATYYQRQHKFHDLFEQGELEQALNVLDKDKKAPEGKNRLLYYLNKGTLTWMTGNHEESIQNFNKADVIAEDYHKNYGNIALTYLTNPMLAEYKPEDFELVMIHYYKAINFMQLGRYDEAMVECRRLNIRLNQLNDKHTKKNRYHVDAFGLNLMGMVYDASGDHNNAFIAYRNALEAYENSYSNLFGIQPPEQLKKDLLRAAHLTGFHEEVSHYEKKFGMKLEKLQGNTPELVFFWNNGLGPVKGENSINFTVLPGQAGFVTFVNQEYNLSFSFPLPKDTAARKGFSELHLLRVALPKYIERPPYFNSASVKKGALIYPLEKTEDINQIAFKTLEDRMLRELGQSVLRLAVKKANEYAIRNQNGDIGAVVGLANALTEKADTRNWQTLPYAVSYARIPLDEGMNTVEFIMYASDRKSNRSKTFTYQAEKGKTYFHAFQSLETLPSHNL